MTVGTPDWRGIPPVDRLSEVLAETGYTLASGVSYTSSVLSIREYQSLQLYYAENAGSYTGKTPRPFHLYFSTDTAGTYRSGVYLFKPGCVTGKLYGQIPTLGPYVNLVIEGVTTGVDSTIDLRVIASHRQLSKPKIFIGNNVAPTLTEIVTADAGTQMWTGTIAAGGSASAYPSYWVGPATVMLETSAPASNAVELAFLDRVHASRIDSLRVVSGASVPVARGYMTLTGEPPEIRVLNSSSGSVNVQVSISAQGAV